MENREESQDNRFPVWDMNPVLPEFEAVVFPGGSDQ
jgi:hypothetical protein